MRVVVEPPEQIELYRLTGSPYVYDYRALERACDDESLRGYVERTRALFAPVAKAFDDRANTEWLLRSYLALKYVLHATVMATSARYSAERNVHISVPYLTYYMLFSTCRAFLLTCPDLAWEGVSTARMSHATALDRTRNLLKRLDGELAATFGQKLQAAKDQRELFSYAFPLSGARGPGGEMLELEEAAIRLASVLAELAQINTACLEGAVLKHGKSRYGLLDSQAQTLMEHPLSGNEAFFDDHDWRWVAKLFATHAVPVVLTGLVSEGMTEDFFGTWAAGDEEGEYDADSDWRVLLNFT